MWPSSLSGIVPYLKLKNSFKRTGLFLNSLIHLVWLCVFFDFLQTPSPSSLVSDLSGPHSLPVQAWLHSAPLPACHVGTLLSLVAPVLQIPTPLISPLILWGVLGAEDQRTQLRSFIIWCRGLLGLQSGLGSRGCSAVLVILCLPSSLLQRLFSTSTVPLISYFYFIEKMEAWTPSFRPIFVDFIFFPLYHIMLDFVSLFAWYRHLGICVEWKTAQCCFLNWKIRL